ncbi:MAG: DNA polymerase III subunit beta [Candidatus Omnitrophica bacterium]|nr:DNA polymerase III subunit beta [Candidatus Omnitrophota bacterium]
MKFIINKEVILEELEKLLGPTTTKQNFPVLSSILITAGADKKLKLTTTDLDITIVSFKEANIAESGSVAVPMKRFISIMRELPNQEITVEKAKNNLLIRCEKIEFKINTVNSEEFPKVEEAKKASFIKIDPQDLRDMIQLTAFCVGYEDVNYVLNGILFEINEDEIRLIATDGKRLSFIKRKLPKTQSDIKTKISFILPIKAINELFKLIKDVSDDILLFIEENKIGFDFKDTQFIARPIEGEFPDYAQYIPKEGKDKLGINRQHFMLALRRADILSTQDYQGVKLELKKDEVVISKNTPQLGEVKETVDAHYNGQVFEIGFNPHYIIDVLKNLADEDVNLEFFGSEKPAILRKEDYIYLVLPLRI